MFFPSTYSTLRLGFWWFTKEIPYSPNFFLFLYLCSLIKFWCYHKIIWKNIGHIDNFCFCFLFITFPIHYRVCCNMPVLRCISGNPKWYRGTFETFKRPIYIDSIIITDDIGVHWICSSQVGLVIEWYLVDFRLAWLVGESIGELPTTSWIY